MINWTQKVFDELLRRGITLQKGEDVDVQILHDDFCDRLNGRGPCNCDPEIGQIGPEPPSRSR